MRQVTAQIYMRRTDAAVQSWSCAFLRDGGVSWTRVDGRVRYLWEGNLFLPLCLTAGSGEVGGGREARQDRYLEFSCRADGLNIVVEGGRTREREFVGGNQEDWGERGLGLVILV